MTFAALKSLFPVYFSGSKKSYDGAETSDLVLSGSKAPTDKNPSRKSFSASCLGSARCHFAFSSPVEVVSRALAPTTRDNRDNGETGDTLF